MADVFISYAGENRATAAALAQALEAAGISVWWDRELAAGDEFASVIEDALDGAGCVVVLWSRAAEKSRWVAAEGQRAFDADKAVPVLLDDLSLPLPLSMIQAPGLADWDHTPGDPRLEELRHAILEHLDTSRLIANAPCPLFRCTAIGEWGCAAGGQDGVVRLWATGDGRLMRELVGHGDLTASVAWDGGRLLATGSADRTARVWSLDDGEAVHVLAGHGGPVDDVCFAGDSVVSVSADRTARWWSIESGEPLHSHAFEHPVLACGAGDAGGLIAVGDTGGNVSILRERDVERILPAAHDGPVYSLRLDPVGDLLLTTGADALARLWDTRTGAVLHTYRGHRGPVLSASFGRDVVVTGSADGTVKLWNADTAEQIDQISGLVGGAPGLAMTPGGSIVMTSAAGHVRTATAPDIEVSELAPAGGGEHG